MAAWIYSSSNKRNNLTLRPRIKRLTSRTICFSQSVKLHEQVIGGFFHREERKKIKRPKVLYQDITVLL
ncbi:hypothetical protein FQU54_26430 [Salmonella enterica subsp. diarizonae]|nr:hypothetical protein [Salmonella enterica subsp. diarizonae]